MSVAELLPQLQTLSKAERLEVIENLVAGLKHEELEQAMPWERDPVVAARFRESIAQAKAGQIVEQALIDP
jgi:hypothetical protein